MSHVHRLKTTLIRDCRLTVARGLLFILVSCYAERVLADTHGVLLSWDASPSDENIVSYQIYYGGMSGTYTNFQSVYDPSAAVVLGLEENATYYFAVKSVDYFGNTSDFSDEVSVQVAAPKPVALQTQVYADGDGVPFAMTITGTNSTPTDWELDWSTNLVNWNYVTGDHGIDVFYVSYFSDNSQIFYRLVDDYTPLFNNPNTGL